MGFEIHFNNQLMSYINMSNESGVCKYTAIYKKKQNPGPSCKLDE